MADLIDRIAKIDPARASLNLHRWMGAQRLYSIAVLTRAQIAAEFDLQGQEATQATQLADRHDAQSSATNKIIYLGRIEAVLMSVEDSTDRIYHNGDGTLNKSKIFTDLQIAG